MIGPELKSLIYLSYETFSWTLLNSSAKAKSSFSLIIKQGKSEPEALFYTYTKGFPRTFFISAKINFFGIGILYFITLRTSLASYVSKID